MSAERTACVQEKRRERRRAHLERQRLHAPSEAASTVPADHVLGLGALLGRR